VAGLAWLAGRALWRRDALVSFGLGLGAVSHLWLGLGLAHLYHPRVAWALWALGAIGSLDLLRHAARAAGTLRTLHTWPRSERVVLALVGALAACLVLGALVPPHAADALRHHFNFAAIAVRDHGLSWAPIGLFAHPQGGEMFYVWGLLLTGPRAGTLVLALHGLVLVAAVALLAREYGGRREALYAAAIVISTPLVWYLTFEAKVDLVYLMHAALALVAFARWRARDHARWLAAAGAFAGFAASSKPLGLYVVLALTLAIGVTLATRRAAARGAIAYAITLAVAGAPWAVRNLAETGDPLWPLLTPWLGGPDGSAAAWRETRERLDVIVPFGRGALGFVEGLSALIAGAPALFGRSLAGPLLLCGVPLLVRVPHAARAMSGLAVVALGYYAIWFAGSQQGRYLLPVTLILAVAAGAGLAAARAAGAAVVIGWCAVSLALALVRLLLVAPVIAGAEPVDAFLERTSAFHREIRWMNDRLPPDAVVASDHAGLYYLERRAIWLTDFQAFVDWERVRDVPDLRAALARYGATHLFLSSPPEDEPGRLRRALAARCGETLYENDAAVMVDSVLLERRRTTGAVIVRLNPRCRD